MHGVKDPGADVPDERRDSYRTDAAELLREMQAMPDGKLTSVQRVWPARRKGQFPK